MKDILRRLASDFLSTILFMAVWLISGEVRIATGIAIVAALAQLVWMKRAGADINAMQWASLGLVVVLGLATLLTHDSRFVMMKPSIAHFVIGTIMLKPGWMSRYMPPIVLDNAPRLPVIAGFCWAGLMFVLGAGVVATALTGDIRLWTIYVTVVAIGAKIAAFAVQYAATYFLVRRSIIARKKAEQVAAS